MTVRLSIDLNSLQKTNVVLKSDGVGDDDFIISLLESGDIVINEISVQRIQYGVLDIMMHCKLYETR